MRTTAVITTVIDALNEQGGSVGRDQIRCAVYLLIHAAGFRMDIGFDHVGDDGIRSAPDWMKRWRLCGLTAWSSDD